MTLALRAGLRASHVLLQAGRLVAAPAGARVLGAMSDLTGRRHFEERQRLLEKNLDLLVRKAPVLFLWTNREGIVKYAAGASFPGATRQAADFVNQPILSLLRTPEEIAAYRALRPGEACHLELKEEGGRIFEIWAEPLSGRDGLPDGHVSLSLEVTGPRISKMELELARCHLRLAAGLGNLGWWEWCPADDRLTWSAEALSVMGWAHGGAPETGGALLAAMDGNGRREFAGAQERARTGGLSARAVHALRRPDGQTA